RAGRHREAGEEVVLDEPDGVEAHPVGENALLDRLLDDRVIVDHRPLHLVGQAQSHAPVSLSDGFARGGRSSPPPDAIVARGMPERTARRSRPSVVPRRRVRVPGYTALALAT